jgi:hypothetical protein
MTKLVNRAKMTTATTGTGTLTLGSAVDGFQTFAAAGVANADVVRYVIEDGDNWEIGTGTYTASGTTLTRTVQESSAAGSAISLSGDAVVFVTAAEQDIVQLDKVQTLANKTLTSPEFTGAIYNNGSFRGNVVAVAALDIDLSAGNYFTKSISANSTFTFSGTPASRAFGFTLRVTVTGDIAITWPASVEFPGDEAPTLTADKTHLFMFATDDGGTTFRGAFLADYEA